MENIQPHIHCKTGDIHENVLLPGDPARVITIAKFFDKAQKVQQNREYLSYSGEYQGMKVSAMSTGIGCPSTLIAMEELANISVKNFVRIGTCGGLKKEMRAGDLIIPSAALKPDGEMLGYILKDKPVAADSLLLESLIEAAQKIGVRYHVGVNRTHDSFYESMDAFLRLKGQNIISSEMECAAIYLVAQLKKLRGGCILVMNTYEPPEEVELDPQIIYKLADTKAVEQGIDNAIKVALEGLKILNAKISAKK